MTFRMSFSSDEVNYLVYRYLLESGNLSTLLAVAVVVLVVTSHIQYQV